MKQKQSDVNKIKDMLKLYPKNSSKIFSLQYVNSSENSDKFYECYVEPASTPGTFYLFAKWGRNGSSGQKKLQMSGTEDSCRAAAHRLKASKIKKGYREG